MAVLCGGLIVSLSMTSVAQGTDTGALKLETSDDISDARKSIDKAQSDVENVRSGEESARFNDARLVEMQLELEDISAAMDQIAADLMPRLDVIKAREKALGEPPGQDQPAEPQSLVDERESLAKQRALVNTDIGDATAVSGDAAKLANAVTAYRRTLFRQTLLGRADLSKYSPGEVRQALVVELGELGSKISSWISFSWQHKRSSLLSALFLSLALGVLFVAGEYQLASRFMQHDTSDENPNAFSRHTLAFWTTLLPVLGLAIFCTLATFFLNSFNVLRGDIAAMLTPFFQFVVILFFVSRLASAVLSPSRPTWRLVRVSDRGAKMLWWLVVAMAFVNAGDYLAGSVSDTLNSPLILTVAKSILATVVIGVILVIASFIHPMMNEDGTSRAWHKSVRLTLLVLGLALIVLPLFGYVGLARFAATQIVVLGALLVTMYLGFLSARAVSEPDAFVGSPVGRLFSNRLHFGQVAVEQFGLLAGLCIYLFVLALGVPIIFLVWGFQVRDIQNWMQDSLSSITIGSVTISITGIMLGLLAFVIGYFATRWFQKWLDDNVMRRGRLEAGLRNSIRTGIGYLGVAIAAVIGASVAGLNLSNLALVAGALSLGIGFGLQNIVNNFVSGLILLAERPFKVGDWIVTSSTQGFVKHISVRATEIETFQRQSVIVPNSELINSPVGNWTHRNRLGRAEIAVGVSYDADPRRVMELLQEIGQSNDLVLHEPGPSIVFMGFGDSSLDFELRVYLSDVLSGLSVATDMRLKIFERFKEEGIEIPFPQRDLHIKLPTGDDGSKAEAAKESLKATAPKKPPEPVPVRLDDPEVD
jgi:small-conductance mechanosensitive channel